MKQTKEMTDEEFALVMYHLNKCIRKAWSLSWEYSHILREAVEDFSGNEQEFLGSILPFFSCIHSDIVDDIIKEYADKEQRAAEREPRLRVVKDPEDRLR